MERLASKILIFSIGSENYGIPIEQVREIIRFDNLTKVHDTQDYIMGVINLRGKIIPVMDLRKKFGISFLPYSDKTVLIILDIEGIKGEYQLALSVDAVHEVSSPKEQEFDKTPELGLNLKRDYLLGILKSENRMVMVLNIQSVVSSEEIIHINTNLDHD